MVQKVKWTLVVVGGSKFNFILDLLYGAHIALLLFCLMRTMVIDLQTMDGRITLLIPYESKNASKNKEKMHPNCG